MSIKKEVIWFEPGFGEATFSDDRCTLDISVVDNQLQGGAMTHNKSLYAPRATILVTKDGIHVDLNFNGIPVSFNTWEKVKRNTDEMMGFYSDFTKEFANEIHSKN